MKKKWKIVDRECKRCGTLFTISEGQVNVGVVIHL